MKKMLDVQKFASYTEVQSAVRWWLERHSFFAEDIEKLVYSL